MRGGFESAEKRLMLLLLLLLCSLCPPCWPWSAGPSSSMVASASAATASWTTVWVDEFEREDVDMEKWQFPDGDSTEEKGSTAAVAGGRNDSNNSSRPHLQVYIGAHDYLVMVAAAPLPPTPPPPPPETTKVDDQDTAAAAAVEPAESASRNRISTVHSADFRYGRVEVRAKVSSRGLSGFWLMPSEVPALGHTPCARVAIAEIRTTEDDAVESPASSVAASINFGDYEEDRWGCTNSNVWPHKGDGCRLTAEHGVDWSDGFHEYALEWEEDEFRWYVDGLHYCTKRDWFEKNPDDFPSPFHKTFHFEMGVEVAAASASAAAAGGGDDASSPAVAPEMLVDYVRISQGPTGWWAPPVDSVAEEGLGLLADEGAASSPPPTALNVLMNVLAVSACVLGPYMAMTGLTRPRTNTILMGMEIGAFKAANASYLFSGSYVMAFVAAVTFGILVGHLAIHHRAVARWNTVAGLAVPALFVLIDVGMISEIGSRYVCWAIFFVLTVTFTVLVFPSEHHALGFAVASAATGSCVLKLGLGWLLGESGEIFKILDDPIGDRCHVSRVCQSLNYVMGAMFFIGLCFQRMFRLRSKNGKVVFDSENNNLEKSRSALFTPPRVRSPLSALVRPRAQALTRKSTCSTGSEFDLEDDGQESIAGGDGERQPALGVGRVRGAAEEEQEGQQEQQQGGSGSQDYDDDEAYILGLGRRKGGGGIWERATAGTRSLLDTVLRPFSSFRRHQVPVSVPPDSPTPVPMPPTGADSNAVVSNQGDTIELVIHSPHKGPLHHRRPSGWFGSSSNGGGGGGGGGSDRGDHRRPESQLFSITGEEEEGDERRRRQQVMATAASPSSSDGYDDALSILSASELVTADDPGTATAAGAPPAGVGVDDNGGAPSGRLADAFSEKWGAWVKDTNSSDDGSAEGGGNGQREGSGRPSPVDNRIAKSTAGGRLGAEGCGGGRSAREFDDEALLLSPFEPHPVVGTANLAAAAAATADATDSDDGGISRFASPLSRSSSSGSVYHERWLWRRRDGEKPPTSSSNSSGAAPSQSGTAVADGPENGQYRPGSGGADICNDAKGKTSSRRESEEGLSARLDAAGVGLQSETKAAVAVPRSNAERHGTSGSPTTASLLEIDI